MFYELFSAAALFAYSIEIYKRGVKDGYERGIKDSSKITEFIVSELMELKLGE